MLNREEFAARFRGRMLVFLTEAWSSRKASPSELGFLMDAHAITLRQLLGDMWEAMAPEPPAPVARPAANGNGKLNTTRSGTAT